ncbi:IncF plasmid conjugative transfer pilus assembly protein TraW [Cupriavidus basilensis]|uniref:IncF plasmid conjugative transfer pilus assembly protein TraW n=1 Tax=Cupriavidus basilensis TaxID=68895 RepID=A0A0C4YH01_9BURK|nr:IncF plasmid conjugative transfer pilus assembly protein TraW [Cupriavidus basilensis]
MHLVPAVAADALGPTYPIVEPDLLQDIRRSLQDKERSGKLALLQREAVARSEHAMRNPKPARDVVRTLTPRTFYFDPTVAVGQPITGPGGEILVQAGQRFNPLDEVALRQQLVFFDARDASQVALAAKVIADSRAPSKPILVNGDYLALQKRWQRQVFYDQSGSLVRKLGIRQVPAVVRQDGKRLRIEEILP